MDDDNDEPSVLSALNIKGEIVKLEDGNYEIIIHPWDIEDAIEYFHDENFPNLTPQDPKWDGKHLIIKLDDKSTS